MEYFKFMTYICHIEANTYPRGLKILNIYFFACVFFSLSYFYL